MSNGKKINLFCDFDNTSVNSTKRLVETLNKKFGTEHNWQDIKQYDAKDLFPDAERKDIIEIFADNKFFDGLEIFDNFLNVFKKYEDKFNYHIATIGTAKNLANKKFWCIQNFDFPYEFCGIERDSMGKESIDMSNGILIDDHIDNLRSSNASIKILYKAGLETDWNTIDVTSKLDNSFWQVDNWEDVDDILKFILRINLLEV